MEIENEEFKERIISAFRERNIPLKRDDVDSAIKDHGTRAWLENHMGSDTLLSKEELTLYFFLIYFIDVYMMIRVILVANDPC